MNLTPHIQKLDQVFGHTLRCPLFLPPFPHLDANLTSKNGHLALLILTYIVTLPEEKDDIFLEESEKRQCSSFIETYLRFTSLNSNADISLSSFLHPSSIYPLIYQWMARTTKLKSSSLSLLLLLDAIYHLASMYPISELKPIVKSWHSNISPSSSTALLNPLFHFFRPDENLPCDRCRLFISLTLLHKCCSATVNWIDEGGLMELTSIYPTLLENEEKATMIYWASTWLEYRFHSDPGWACSILEAMLSLQENIDIVGTMFQDLPFIVDLTKAFSATETFSELKESLDPLFQSTYEKLKNMASNIFWPPPTFMSVPDIKEENFMEDVVSPIGPKFEKAMTLEPLDPIIKQKVLSYMYNDDVDEDEDEDLEESENTSHVSCPMTLIEAYSKDPSVFQRTAKDSLERDRLRKATGLNDHQIEGWGSYLRRNPKKMRSVVSGFSGHQQHLPSTRYRSNG